MKFNWALCRRCATKAKKAIDYNVVPFEQDSHYVDCAHCGRRRIGRYYTIEERNGKDEKENR